MRLLTPHPLDTQRVRARFACHGGDTVCQALEVIHNPNRANSRFLRGASLHWGQVRLN